MKILHHKLSRALALALIAVMGLTPGLSVPAFASSHMSLEIADHCFDAFGIGLQLRAKVGQAIAGRCARYQFPPKPLFQLGEPALHCRLASAKYLACGDRAAAARNSEKVFEIIPIEH